MGQKEIVILPAPGCRRSRKLIEYLESRNIPFTRLELDSSQGQALAEQYDLRASPGILVNGVSINPFDLLVQPVCRVNEAKAEGIFTGQKNKKPNKMGRGEVIQTLRLSSVLAPLTEAELRELANCGRICFYETSQHIVTVDDRDDYMFVLRRGRVALHITMLPAGGQCEGEARVELGSPGEVFGWGAWLRPDGITVAAYALEPCSLVRLNLDRLKEVETSWKVSWRMLQNLYGLLQERGLCPPNMQALLKLGQVATLEWMPASGEG